MEAAADHGLDVLAARLRALPPSCGPVRLVAVDGHAGSGKSTFAGRLAAACGEAAVACGEAAVAASPRDGDPATPQDGDPATPQDGDPATPQSGGPATAAPVIHLDDLATHEELFAWDRRLREQVIDPFSEGRSARYGVYDWVRQRFVRECALAPAPVVLLEGVGAGRSALRPYLACLLWMELPDEAAWTRGRRRDGPELAAFWDGWIPAERAHFAADPSRPYADLLVSQVREGYEWHTRPVDAR
ncbi:uridine kinase family protein [Streptomyces sclerotialus]|uniref:uridine kinase family protein n=1 Tax=Streptomyces sclerotialus TaxID=1957 RepID=UPI0005658C78